MIRKVVRAVAGGLCLLSLAVCVGAGWLWWHAGRVYGDYVEVAAGGVYLGVSSAESDLSVLAIGRWPGRAMVRAASVPDGDGLMSWPGVIMWPESAGRRVLAARWGAEAAAGSVRVGTNPDGTPLVGPYRLRFTAADRVPTVRLPYWNLAGVRHG